MCVGRWGSKSSQKRWKEQAAGRSRGMTWVFMGAAVGVGSARAWGPARGRCSVCSALLTLLSLLVIPLTLTLTRLSNYSRIVLLKLQGYFKFRPDTFFRIVPKRGFIVQYGASLFRFSS